MSKREEIKGNQKFDELKFGIVYTEVLGWLEMGHAGGDDISLLKQQFDAGESSGNKYYSVIYKQNMRIRSKTLRQEMGTGKFTRWEIQRGRTQDEINSIMLAMMMNTALKFEAYQSLKAFSWHTDSGFSGEDLVSDLFGFYRFMIPGKYSSLVRPVCYNDAVSRWDFYGPVGSFKNDGFRPILFPDPKDPCVKHKPYKVNLPHFMTWIQPWSDFTSGKIKIITNDGTSFSFLPI
ncbi:hypothetical protein FYF11_15235 [Salmonella enterica]|nr:hypothetical protein [Salmonella enterica]